jgi:hypothetical protein
MRSERGWGHTSFGPHRRRRIKTMQPYKKTIPIVAPQYRIPRTPAGKYQGNQVAQIAVATFNPSANTGERTVAAHGLGVSIPTKAIITKVWYDVVTTFTSAADTATVALHVQAADDLLAAVAIGAAGDVLDAGSHAGLIGYPNLGADAAHDSQVEVAALFAATHLKMTAEREITATVAVQALTAGKMNIFVEYVISD